MRFPGHRVTAIAQCRDCRVILVVRDLCVDQALAVDWRRCRARRREALREDAVAGAILSFRFPDDDKAAVAKRRHVRIVLIIVGFAIHLKFVTDRIAEDIEALAEDAITAAILIFRLPHHHEAAIGEPADRGIILVRAGAVLINIRRFLIDLEFAAERIALIIEDPREYVVP